LHKPQHRVENQQRANDNQTGVFCFNRRQNHKQFQHSRRNPPELAQQLAQAVLFGRGDLVWLMRRASTSALSSAASAATPSAANVSAGEAPVSGKKRGGWFFPNLAAFKPLLVGGSETRRSLTLS
jgi:hypothetical protein